MKRMIIAMLVLIGLPAVVMATSYPLSVDTKEETVTTEADINNWLKAHDPKTYPQAFIVFRIKDSGKTAVYGKAYGLMETKDGKKSTRWSRVSRTLGGFALRGVTVHNDL